MHQELHNPQLRRDAGQDPYADVYNDYEDGTDSVFAQLLFLEHWQYAVLRRGLSNMRLTS